MKKLSDLELELQAQIEEYSEYKVTPAHLREALSAAHYQLDNKRKEVYLQKGRKRILVEKQEAVDHVISCILGNFPEFYTEEPEKAALERGFLARDFVLLQQEKNEWREQLRRAGNEYEELRGTLEQEKSNANHYLKLLLAERTDKENIILQAQRRYRAVKGGVIAGLVLAAAGVVGASYFYRQNVQLQREMETLERKYQMRYWEEPNSP